MANADAPRTLTTADVAKLLSTSPKTFRTFLRSRNSGVGSGARYSFNHADLADLGVEFEQWQNDRVSPASTRRNRKATVDAAMAESRHRRGIDLHTATRADIEELTNARVDRLEQQLRDAGLHISQIRDRDGEWLARTV